MVMPETTFEVPRRLGDPKSPMQISESPCIRRRSQAEVSDMKVCWARVRVPVEVTSGRGRAAAVRAAEVPADAVPNHLECRAPQLLGTHLAEQVRSWQRCRGDAGDWHFEHDDTQVTRIRGAGRVICGIGVNRACVPRGRVACDGVECDSRRRQACPYKHPSRVTGGQQDCRRYQHTGRRCDRCTDRPRVDPSNVGVTAFVVLPTVIAPAGAADNRGTAAATSVRTTTLMVLPKIGKGSLIISAPLSFWCFR